MSKLRQGVCLILKLRKGRGSEELLDSRCDGSYVYKCGRGHYIYILRLDVHPLANDSFHSGETDSELVLQKLTDTADSSVAQVVYIVYGSDALADVYKRQP